MVLMTAAELAERLDEFSILDVRYYLTEPGRGRTEYGQAHIPGAVFVDLDRELAAHPRPDRVGGRHPRPGAAALQRAARSWGLGHGRGIVVYDQSTSLAAGRAWWLLTDAGLEVQVLDGGFRAWTDQGLPVTAAMPEVAMGDVVLRPGHLTTVDAAGVAARDRGTRLIDVRAPERYSGETEPLDRIPGRIPGAENLPAAALLTERGGFRSPSELAALFGDLGPADILSCGSGITAAQVALAAAHAGLPVPRLYLGSYSDWVSDPSRPVERG